MRVQRKATLVGVKLGNEEIDRGCTDGFKMLEYSGPGRIEYAYRCESGAFRNRDSLISKPVHHVVEYAYYHVGSVPAKPRHENFLGPMGRQERSRRRIAVLMVVGERRGKNQVIGAFILTVLHGEADAPITQRGQLG